MKPHTHEITRVESFSDAVFAFALTLLVVSLEVPRELSELLNLVRGFLPFAAMFAMVCWIWYEHSLFFRRYGLQDGWTVTLNCALLFVVLFYVYPLKFLTVGILGPVVGMQGVPRLTGERDARAIMLLYSGGVVLVFGLFVLFYTHAWRHRRALGLSADDEIRLRYARRGHMITAGVALLSMAIVVFFSGSLRFPIAGFSYFLLAPLRTINGRQAALARRGLAASSASHRR
jgi:uncharacterized membrane protein